MKKTRLLVKVNANDLFSGRVHEHTLHCQCGPSSNIQGTVTGRISSNDVAESNRPKAAKFGRVK